MARRFVYAYAQTMGRDILVNDKCGKPYIITPQYALEKIDEALAEPLLNCDVGSLEEQSKRFGEFCTPRKCRECTLYVDGAFGDCGVRWSQMPYESEATNG